jgi:hypothetical protein
MTVLTGFNIPVLRLTNTQDAAHRCLNANRPLAHGPRGETRETVPRGGWAHTQEDRFARGATRAGVGLSGRLVEWAGVGSQPDLVEHHPAQTDRYAVGGVTAAELLAWPTEQALDIPMTQNEARSSCS